jgi:uncharacterized protein YfaS (alpha-2-macroglobulin family)
MLLGLLLAACAPSARAQAPDAGGLARAEQLFQQGHWAQARATFDAASRAAADCHTPEARRAVQGAVTCSLRLGDWEGSWDRVELFRQREKAQPTARPSLRRRYAESPEAQAARRAVGHFELVRQLLGELARDLTVHPDVGRQARLTAGRIALNFTLIDYLLGPEFEALWTWSRDTDRWWDATDLPPTEGAEEEEPWSYSAQGIPLGPGGTLRFLHAPTNYSDAAGPGVKVLFLLQEIESLDHTPIRDQAARAVLRRAQIARTLYGPSSDPSWEHGESVYAFRQRPAFLKEDAGAALKPFWELGEHEARTPVAGRVQVVSLPQSESPLALLRLLEHKYPRSTLVPEAVYLRGLYYQSRQQFARALDEFRDLRKRYPQHPRAEDAQHKIDAILHADVLLGRAGFFPAGTRPTLWFSHRQTDKVVFSARAFDLPRFLRTDMKAQASSWQHSLFGAVVVPSLPWIGDEERLRPFLGKESVVWSEAVAKNERIGTQTTRPPLTAVGAYLVEARVPGRKRASRVLVVLTDLVLVHKHTPGKWLFYAADAQTGRPVPDLDLQCYLNRGNKGRTTTLHTNAEGVALAALDSEYEALALATSAKGGIAVITVEPWYSRSQERQATGYAVTDRPVYRPGDTVRFRLWVRELEDRAYRRPRADQPVAVTIHDPQGNTARTFDLRTDQDGAVTGELPLGAEAALGAYAIRIDRGNDPEQGPAAWFRVEAYKKPEFEVTVQTDEKPVRPGAGVRVRVTARYVFGGPVSGAHVRYRFFRDLSQPATPAPQLSDWLHGAGYGRSRSHYPWLGDTPEADSEEAGAYDWTYEERVPLRQGEGQLDGAGTLPIDIDTTFLGRGNTRLLIEAEVRDSSRRTIRGKGTVIVADRDRVATIQLDRGWYRPGERSQVEIVVHAAGGTGAPAHGVLELARIRYEGRDHEQVRMEELHRSDVATNAEGLLRQRLPSLGEGQYRVRFLTHDSRNEEVAAQAVFWVHGPQFDAGAFRFPDLEILPDQRTYRIGDTAHLLIHVAQPNARVLWSEDASDNRLRTYRFLDIAGHVAVISVRIEARQVPNFFVEATTVRAGQAHVAACEVLVPPVEDLLRVQVTADKTVCRPGENGAIRVAVTDNAGKPVVGRVTLTAFDKAVAYFADGDSPGPRVLLAKRKAEHHVEPEQTPYSWRLESEGRFSCPEFEILDGGHRFIGGMGGAAPTGGDPADAGTPSPHPSAQNSGRPRRPQEPPEPVIREDRGDTALWRAALDLGADGTARVPLSWPQTLATWQLRAYALTASTQVGDAAALVRTSKDLLVRLQTPRLLAAGDEVVLAANVHSALPGEQPVATELIVPAALLASSAGAAADADGFLHLRAERVVKAGASERFEWPLRALRPGTANVTVKARAKQESDAVRVTVPIQPLGVRHEEAWVGRLAPRVASQRTVAFSLPQELDLAQTHFELALSSGAVGAVLDALPMLMGYPYGCTEQTMSRFYPTVLAAETLKKLGVAPGSLARLRPQADPRLVGRFRELQPVYDPAELRRMAELGLERLYNFQHADGGWGWWRDDASATAMTAYVLMGLQITRQAGIDVRADVMHAGYDYLLRTIDRGSRATPPTGAHALEADAYLAYELSWAVAHTGEPGGLNPERQEEARAILQPLRTRLVRRRSELGAYGLSLLALALHESKEAGPARELLQLLGRLVQRNADDDTAFVPAPGRDLWHGRSQEIETNAWALRAILRIDGPTELASSLARWLVLHRRNGTFWESTRDSALAVVALADYVLAQKGEAAACRVVVRLDGRAIREVALAPADFLAPAHRLTFDGSQLPPGAHVVTLEKSGAGEVYYAGRLRTFLKRETFPPAGKRLSLKRAYFALDGDTGRRTPLTDGASVAVGSLVEVALTIEAEDAYEYLAFEDPKPAGCEPVQLQSGGRWLDWSWANVELRDEGVAFFVSSLDRGRHVLRYRLRAEVPGLFHVLPASGFAMYAPEIQASSAGQRLRIAEP